MDGALLRIASRSRPSGALLDSVMDRYAEIAFFGLLVYFHRLNSIYSFYGVCLVAPSIPAGAPHTA